MSIIDYASLQTAVGTWLHRTTDLTALIPDFISLAEAKMNGDLAARSMDVRTTLTCVPGSTLTARLVALPTDVIEIKRLTVVDADPATVLEYKSPDQLVADNPWLLTSGKPRAFTVIGGNVELAPPPDAAYPLELIYRQRIPPLSNSNTTNWLLAQNPSVYLFGALLAAAPYTLDDDRLPAYQSSYAQAVATVNEIDWYSGSTMRVKSA